MTVESAAEKLLSGLPGYPRDIPRCALVWEAPWVWSQFLGDKIDCYPCQVWPQGIEGVVAGLQWDHPVLIHPYRGCNGATANHNSSWWEAIGAYPSAPADGAKTLVATVDARALALGECHGVLRIAHDSPGRRAMAVAVTLRVKLPAGQAARYLPLIQR